MWLKQAAIFEMNFGQVSHLELWVCKQDCLVLVYEQWTVEAHTGGWCWDFWGWILLLFFKLWMDFWSLLRFLIINIQLIMATRTAQQTSSGLPDFLQFNDLASATAGGKVRD